MLWYLLQIVVSLWYRWKTMDVIWSEWNGQWTSWLLIIPPIEHKVSCVLTVSRIASPSESSYFPTWKMVILSQNTTNSHSRIEIVISENDLLFGHFLLIPCFSCALDHSSIQYRNKGKHDSVKGRIRFHRGHLFSQCDSILACAMIPSIIHSTSSCIY